MEEEHHHGGEVQAPGFLGPNPVRLRGKPAAELGSGRATERRAAFRLRVEQAVFYSVHLDDCFSLEISEIITAFNC